MITDTCSCGALIHLDHLLYCDAARQHRDWLAAHEVCRTGSEEIDTETQIVGKGGGEVSARGLS